MKIFSIFLVLSILISSCTWLKEHEYEGEEESYNRGMVELPPGISSASGKCYAKCLIQDQFENDVLVKKGGYTEWKEIVCAEDVTPRLYKNIQIALIKAGHNIKADGTVNAETKNALVRFQKDNGLPEGALDAETLRLLEIR